MLKLGKFSSASVNQGRYHAFRQERSTVRFENG